MKNAHLRFGWLGYFKRTEKTTTNFRLRLDRFIGEVEPDPPRRARAHFVSVLGADTQIAAVNAAISLDERFEIEGPGVERISVGLGRNAQTNKGALQLEDRKKPLRHLVGISEEFSTPLVATGRTLLADSRPLFVWSSLAHIHGLPGVPEWADWFYHQLESHKALVPLLGVGCQPVLIQGNKQQFLSWLGKGVQSGDIEFPSETGPIQWGGSKLADVFSLAERSARKLHRIGLRSDCSGEF
jgi:hypothetical protein